MLIKVYGRTSVHGDESLCDTCRHARIVRGRAIHEELVFCDAPLMRSNRITFKVATCTDYIDSRLPPYEVLAQQAWILKPASKRRAAGFVRAADLSAAEAMRLLSDLPDRG